MQVKSIFEFTFLGVKIDLSGLGYILTCLNILP